MRVAVIGFGVVGRAFAELLNAKRDELYRAYALSVDITGVADRGGAVVCEHGLDVNELLAAKHRDGTVAGLTGKSVVSCKAGELAASSGADVVVESTPSDMSAPQSAMINIKTALSGGCHVITVNKAPLAVAMPALIELADFNGVELRYSGTVGGGTPMLAMAQECSRGDRILRIRAILNGTTNFILSAMHGSGQDFETALAEAVRLGYAETDPSADIDGIDSATKLVILANLVMNRGATFGNVAVEGIRGLGRDVITEAEKSGEVIKLISEIDANTMRVLPQRVQRDAPLNVPANLNAMTLTLKSSGDVTLVGRGAGGIETATAMLRDLLDIWTRIGGSKWA